MTTDVRNNSYMSDVAECEHEFMGFGRTPYKGVYIETCTKCGLTRKYEQDYT